MKSWFSKSGLVKKFKDRFNMKSKKMRSQATKKKRGQSKMKSKSAFEY